MPRIHAYQRILDSIPHKDHPDVIALTASVREYCEMWTPRTNSAETIDRVWTTALKMIANGEATDPKTLAAAAASVR